MAADVSPHLQEPADLAGLHLKHVKGVNVFPNLPGVATVGRTFCDDAFDEACCAAGAAGAATWIARFRAVYEDNQHVAWWQGPNEFILSTTTRANAWAAFHVAFAEQMDALGFRVCSGGINTGWPRLRYYGDPPPYVELLGPAFEALRAYGGIASFHEYWGSAGPLAAAGNFGRIQKTVQEAADHGVTLPPVFIGECGLDQHVVDGGAHRGWKDVGLTAAQYGAHLQTAMDCYRALGYVIGASVFTVCSWDWSGFDARPVFPKMGEINMQEPTVTRARGIDVSEHRGEIDWQAVAASGVAFAFIRASSGSHLDVRFAENWEGAGAAGVLRGAYHYLVAGVGGQARTFVFDAVGDRIPELGWWCDAEDVELTADKVVAHLHGVDARLADKGHDAWAHVYTRASFWNPLGVPAADVAGRRLWVAHWTHDPAVGPTIPAAWDEWEFWQYSNQGVVPGVNPPTDLDLFRADGDALRAEYGDEPEPPGAIQYRDYGGELTTEAWFRGEFGDFLVEAGGAYQVSVLYAVTGPATFRVHVLDAQGAPVEGLAVDWYWPDGHTPGTTNAEGYADFGMGPGAYYWPPARGPHWITVGGATLRGIGMLGGTDHDHFNAVVVEGGLPDQWTLVVAVVGQGCVALDPPGGVYPAGSSVVLEATAAEGWRFAGWSGDLGGGENPAVLVMDGDRAVTATFAEEGGGVDLAIQLIGEAKAIIEQMEAEANALLDEAVAILEDLP